MLRNFAGQCPSPLLIDLVACLGLQLLGLGDVVLAMKIIIMVAIIVSLGRHIIMSKKALENTRWHRLGLETWSFGSFFALRIFSIGFKVFFDP